MISTRSSTLASALAIAIATTAIAPRAHAQTDTAIAEGLFREGKKLLDAKKYADACPKFEESARLQPSSGVELALGICYEGLGKTASAWGAYQTAVSLARRDNRRDRERVASARASALEPKIAHATIDVPAGVAQLDGLQVKEDSVVMGAAAWKDSPIDPGTHTLEVTATGKKSWTTTFMVDAGTKSVSVPMLEDDLSAQQQTVVRVAPTPTNPFRIAAVATLGGGAVVAVVASILGGIAISDKNDAAKTCSPPKCGDANAVAENDSAGTVADWSTALFVVSGAVIATSVVLFFLRPSGGASSSWHVGKVHPIVSPNFFGVGGVF
jgi:hypothetical protein